MDGAQIGDGNHLLRKRNKSQFTCIPVGLTQGQFNINSFKVPDELKWFQMRSACLMAFCYIYLKDPLKWSAATINTIIIHGAKLVKDNYVEPKDCGIINCTINVQNYIAKIQIEEPSTLDTIYSNTSIFKNLQVFFRDHEYGLMRCSNLCYLIWRTNGIYFVFDAQGRNNACLIEKKNGFASLVCTESLKDVSKLIKSLSGLRSDDCYSLSAIKMKHFRSGQSECIKPRIQYAGTDTYSVVNDCFAILNGKIHIGHSGFQCIKNRQALTVCLMALIYNEMQPSNSWTNELVDKVILLGTKLFHECKKTPQGEVTIRHLPREYNIRDYKCKIDYRPYDHSGQMSYSVDEMKENLLLYLRRAFQGNKSSSLLIQTNSSVFAVWRSNGYYYLFDAYARNDVGELSGDKFGQPCIHMHSNLESLCSVLSMNLATSTKNEGFVLHGINVALECKCGGKVGRNDLELLNIIMDDLFWEEMNSFRELSSRSEDVCNLDESSDEDVFMETIDRKIRARPSSVSSSISRTTTSTMSGSTSISSTKSSKDVTSRTSDSNKKSSDSSSASLTLDGSDQVDQESKNSEMSLLYSSTKDEHPERITDIIQMSIENYAEEQLNAPAEMDEIIQESRKNKLKKLKQGESVKKSPRNVKKTKSQMEELRNNAKKTNNQLEESQNDAKKTNSPMEESQNDNKKTNCQIEEPMQNDAKTRKNSQINLDTEINEDEELTESGQITNEVKNSLVVVKSSSGTEASITKLLETSLKISDRVLLVTDWGDFFIARTNSMYVFCDGCFCDYNSLIKFDLKQLDNFQSANSIPDVVSKILLFKNDELALEKYEPKERIDLRNDFYKSNVNDSFWELVEGMMELVKTTAKFEKIKKELM